MLLRDEGGAYDASAKLDLKDPTTITIGPSAGQWTVTFGNAGTVTTSEGLAVEVTGSDTSVVQMLKVRRITTDGSIVLTVTTHGENDVKEQSLGPDQSLSLQLGTRLITMANTILPPEGTSSPTLYVMSVTTELLLPPKVRAWWPWMRHTSRIVPESWVAILRNGVTTVTTVKSGATSCQSRL